MKTNPTRPFANARAVRTAALSALCLAALLAGGCASRAKSPTAMRAVAANTSAGAPQDSDFPAMKSAKWSEGAYPSREALRDMRTGMGKDQVRGLLGYPHFSEGILRPREWNYIFHFRTGPGPEHVTCQYMVRFDSNMLTQDMYWREPACADLLQPRTVAVAPAPVMQRPPPAPPARTTLGADGLFRFDGFALSDLLPDGQRKLDALAIDIQRNAAAVERVVITGHADQLGGHAHNQALSLARAKTVRDYLTQAGVPTALMQVQDRGESEPKVQCNRSGNRSELIDCLAPNRRVEIAVFMRS